MGELRLFEKIFGLATGFYVAAFAAAVYSATESVTTRTVSVLFVTALPALLATEICGGDSKASQALVESWIKEFVGTAVMVAATCSPGAVVGHYGYKPEWLLHVIMVFIADYSCGGPQANPAVTASLLACGGFGLTMASALVKVFAQVGGGIIGWRLLLVSGDTFLAGDVGGPSPNPRLPWVYLTICEALGCWTLLGAVYCFATSKPFAKAGELARVYSIKMSLIAATVRLIIVVHGATGPAINPALATSYELAANGELPGLASTHYTTYWLGGLAGAVAMGFIWKAISTSDSARLFPDEVFKIVVGVYLSLFGTVLWASFFRPHTESIVSNTLHAEWEHQLRSRNVFQKLLRRKPRAA